MSFAIDFHLEHIDWETFLLSLNDDDDHFKQNAEIVNWTVDHLDGVWSFVVTSHGQIRICIEDRKDAMMFKLRWSEHVTSG